MEVVSDIDLLLALRILVDFEKHRDHLGVEWDLNLLEGDLVGKLAIYDVLDGLGLGEVGHQVLRLALRPMELVKILVHGMASRGLGEGS